MTNDRNTSILNTWNLNRAAALRGEAPLWRGYILDTTVAAPIPGNEDGFRTEHYATFQFMDGAVVCEGQIVERLS